MEAMKEGRAKLEIDFSVWTKYKIDIEEETLNVCMKSRAEYWQNK